MKNILYPIALFSLLFFIGCEDDEADAVDCAGLAATYTEATEAFYDFENPESVGLTECQAFTDAFVTLIESGCEGFSLEAAELTQEEFDTFKDGSYCDLLYPSDG